MIKINFLPFLLYVFHTLFMEQQRNLFKYLFFSFRQTERKGRSPRLSQLLLDSKSLAAIGYNVWVDL
ncbi:hypothetical protein XENTR_v10006179 [Xenopus tropicalis]|nr:hypothetical protein XENTR_v10006179 [Xenopus tropicalis]